MLRMGKISPLLKFATFRFTKDRERERERERNTKLEISRLVSKRERVGGCLFG